MFDLTSGAAALIDTLIQESNLGCDSGLRFDVNPTCGSLAMRLANSPSDNDVVVGRHDARVFIGPSAADRLAAQTLDARGEIPMFLLINR